MISWFGVSADEDMVNAIQEQEEDLERQLAARASQDAGDASEGRHLLTVILILPLFVLMCLFIPPGQPLMDDAGPAGHVDPVLTSPARDSVHFEDPPPSPTLLKAPRDRGAPRRLVSAIVFVPFVRLFVHWLCSVVCGRSR